MNALARLWAAWLRWLEDRRDQAAMTTVRRDYGPRGCAEEFATRGAQALLVVLLAVLVKPRKGNRQR